MRSRWGLALIVAGTLAYYFWLGLSSIGSPRRVGPLENDYYNAQARGFRNGHLSLDLEVPAALIKAANPYDPAQRPPNVAPHDVSYFQGKYYSYFGVAPTVTLFLPWHWLTGRELPAPYAVLIFSVAGYLALIASFDLLRRRYYPAASGWAVGAGLLALGGATLVVALLRRPNIWELAIASGFCWFALSLWLLFRSFRSRRPWVWAGAAGWALGLAVASRPTYLFESVLIGVPLLAGAPAWSRTVRSRLRPTLAWAAGCGIIIAGLLAFNAARFGNPLEFGEKYQLSSIVEGSARHFSFSFVPGNVYLYLMAPLHWQPWFPFVSEAVGLANPAGYAGDEYVFGILTNLPICLFAVAALRGRRPVALLLALAAILALGPLLFFFGACIRYMADFIPALVLLSALGVLELEDASGSRAAVWAVRLVAWVLAGFSCFSAAMAVVNIYDTVPGVFPAAYLPVAHWLDLPGALFGKLAGAKYGPVTLGVRWPAANGGQTHELLRVGGGGGSSCAILAEEGEGGTVRFGYRAGWLQTPAWGPRVPREPGQLHAISVSLGEFYPPAFQGIVPGVSADQAIWLRNWILVKYDGTMALELPEIERLAGPPVVSVGARPSGMVAVQGRSGQGGFEGFRLPPGSVRLRLRITPAMAGRSFPIAVSGRPGKGDSLILQITPQGDAGFIYDHWAAPVRRSPVFAGGFGTDHQVEFRLPAPTAGPTGPLLAQWDDRPPWRESVRVFPGAERDIIFGRGAVDSSWCEPEFAEARFELLPPSE